MTIFTARFAVAAAERAVKTFAQSLLAVFLAGQVDILTVDWPQSLAVAGTAAVVSLLTSVASAGIGPHGPSLADESIIEPLRMTTGPDGLPTYAPVTGDANAIVPPGTSTAYRLPVDESDILE